MSIHSNILILFDNYIFIKLPKQEFVFVFKIVNLDTHMPPVNLEEFSIDPDP